jgi:bacteriorhodopsin
MLKFNKNISLDTIKFTFKISGIWLLCVGIYILLSLCFIKDNIARVILLSETIVLAIASYFYIKFIKDINKPNYNINYITQTRYIDWSLTTPLLLISFTLFLKYYNNFNKNNKNIFDIKKYLIIFILNFIMLLFGYFGEINKLNKNIALIISFIFFILLILFIWYNFVFNSGSLSEYIIFLIFTIIWSLYGISYTFNDNLKNYSYNILDTFSKGLFGFILVKFYIYKQFFG